MLNAFFPPKDPITESDVKTGMRMLMLDGVCSQVMGVFTTGAFLAAYAVLIGASNFTIGLIAAIGPLTQILQIPAIYLVNRTQIRRGLVVLSSVLSRGFWLLIAATPFLLPKPWQLPVFMVSLFLFFGFGAISGCAWNSWVRDLIPDKVRGVYFGKRLGIATAVGAALSLVAGFAVDYYKSRYPDQEISAYSVLIIIGATFGFVGIFFLWKTPEPKLIPPDDTGFWLALKQPFKDENYQKLLIFLGIWNFAVNFAAPFFSIYMLKRLGMSMSWIIGLAVLSQFVNVIFFKIWGEASDRFSNKAVLGVSGSLFVFSFLIWPFTTMPEQYALTLPLLIVIHVVSGISTAGVTLCSATIAAKIAPNGKATSYLATNAFVCGIAATAAPLLAGALAEFLEYWDLTLALSATHLQNPDKPLFLIPAFTLRGLDYLFVIAFFIGLYALHRLLAVQEVGEVERGALMRNLYSEARRSARAISNVAGLRALTCFPYERLLKHPSAKKVIPKIDIDPNRQPDVLGE